MTRRRLAYFILGILGGLVAGAGALATWRSIEMGAISVTRGTDTPAGKAALALSLAVIVLTLATRKGTTEEPRGWPITVVFIIGLLVAGVGGLAAAQLNSVYQDTREADAIRISEGLQRQGHEATPEEVLAQMDEAETRKPGPGPWMMLGGGILIICAAAFGYAWQKEWRSAQEQPSARGEAAPSGTEPAAPVD